MSARTPDPRRAWKDHRRTCAHCDLGLPGCEEGRSLEAEVQAEATFSGPGGALAGSRMGTAFVWGFWFTSGAGVASGIVAALWLLIWAAARS